MRDHAVVIGGSMAGLCAARALAGHFRQVTVVERDHFPDAPGERKGVPQARHVHILLAQGQRVLEELFPGLTDTLVAHGARLMDWTAEAMTLYASGWGRRMPSNLRTLGCSRDLLEWAVRQRLAALPNVTMRTGCEVVDLATGPAEGNGSAGPAVQGVVLRLRGTGDTATTEALPADLVVDASGRSSHAPEWLEAHGYGRPHESVVNSFLGYASRWYRRPPAFNADWQALLIVARPPHVPYGGVLLPVEGDRWLVTLAGIGHHYPPTDETGFLEFAQKLADPLLYTAIRQAEPLTPVYGYRRTENRRRHFEEMARWPAGLLVVGDAACAFNPVYGQGMTAAALGARTLDELLRRHPARSSGFELDFQRALAKVNTMTWLLATGEDLRWPTTEGGQVARRDRWVQWYVQQVVQVAVDDPQANQAFAEVLHLVKPPSALFAPHLLWKVLRRWGRPGSLAKMRRRQVGEERQAKAISHPSLMTGGGSSSKPRK